MNLEEFRKQTSHLPGDTEVYIAQSRDGNLDDTAATGVMLLPPRILIYDIQE